MAINSRFVFKIIVFTLIIEVLLVALNRTKIALPFLVYFIPAYFSLLTIFSIKKIISAKGKAAQQFVTTFMLSTSIRLLLNLLIVVGFLLINKQEAFLFVIAFLIIYFSYLTIEVFFLSSFFMDRPTSNE